jgi:hypothetical protein
MNLIDEAQGGLPMLAVAGLAVKLQKVADGEGVGPQVAPRSLSGKESGPFGKFSHGLLDYG